MKCEPKQTTFVRRKFIWETKIHLRMLSVICWPFYPVHNVFDFYAVLPLSLQSLIDRYLVPGGHLNIKMLAYQYRDPMWKIRRSRDRLIFNMGIPIPGKDNLYTEMGFRWFCFCFQLRYHILWAPSQTWPACQETWQEETSWSSSSQAGAPRTQWGCW